MAISTKVHFCVHQGYKVLASLIITRPPIHFSEPDELREFRQFQETWETKHSTAPPIDEHQLVYMRLPTHFLPSKGDRERTQGTVPFRNKAEKRVDDKFLHLVVKYRNADFWTFPFAHRKGEVSMRKTLSGITENQLNLPDAHIINYTPSFVRKIDSPQQGAAKIFYYRALHAAGGAIKGEEIADFAWMTRTQLKDKLSPGTWQAANEVLPLDEAFLKEESST
jgi:hypothetical protein